MPIPPLGGSGGGGAASLTGGGTVSTTGRTQPGAGAWVAAAAPAAAVAAEFPHKALAAAGEPNALTMASGLTGAGMELVAATPMVGEVARRKAKLNAVADLCLLDITVLPTSAHALTRLERSSIPTVAMIGKSYRMMTKKTRKSNASSQDEPESAGRPILMFCSNTAWNLANFRGPLIASLAADGCRVIAAAAADGTEDRLLELGAEFHRLPVKASSRNPLHELRFLASIVALLQRERPSALLTFTIKPNIYGTMAARLAGVRAIATVSGLGSAFLAGGVTARLIDALYKIGFARASSNDWRQRIIKRSARCLLPAITRKCC